MTSCRRFVHQHHAYGARSLVGRTRRSYVIGNLLNYYVKMRVFWKNWSFFTKMLFSTVKNAVFLGFLVIVLKMGSFWPKTKKNTFFWVFPKVHILATFLNILKTRYFQNRPFTRENEGIWGSRIAPVQGAKMCTICAHSRACKIGLCYQRVSKGILLPTLFLVHTSKKRVHRNPLGNDVFDPFF